MATPISTLAANTQSRLEEAAGPGAWWSLQFELYSAIQESQNDLMLLTGRPTQIVTIPFTLTANTVWQTVPKGYFQITDILGARGNLYKLNLYDLDYLQTAWGSDWEQDVGVPHDWAPIGFNLFLVHPAPPTPQQVLLTAIQYPTTDVWPYTGSEDVQFSDEFFVALEIYAAAYGRLKELGTEAQGAVALMQQYLNLARRMTQISDRRDPLIFSMGFGASQSVNPTTKR